MERLGSLGSECRNITSRSAQLLRIKYRQPVSLSKWSPQWWRSQNYPLNPSLKDTSSWPLWRRAFCWSGMSLLEIVEIKEATIGFHLPQHWYLIRRWNHKDINGDVSYTPFIGTICTCIVLSLIIIRSQSDYLCVSIGTPCRERTVLVVSMCTSPLHSSAVERKGWENIPQRLQAEGGQIFPLIQRFFPIW